MSTEKHDLTFKWPGGLRLINEETHFIEKDWDAAIFRTITAAAERFVPGFRLGEAKFEEKERQGRDDNGDYDWTNSYKRGDAERHVIVECRGFRGEDLMYPTPMQETREYEVSGLKEGQKIAVSLRYEQCAVILTSMTMSVSIAGEATAADEAKSLFVREFTKSNKVMGSGEES